MSKEEEEGINKKQIKLNPLLQKYYTCRIDIKNFGNESNSIEIIENSDQNSKIIFPDWFKNETGTGLIINSAKLSIDLKIKCINNGALNLTLIGLDIRDRKNNRFPVYIDYTSLKINNKEQLKENKLVCHDEPLRIKRKVKDNELIKIHAEWQPFNSSSLYENKKIKELEDQIKKLEEENQNYKEKLNLISNSSL